MGTWGVVVWRRKHSPCVPGVSYDLRQAFGSKGRVKCGSAERIHEPASFEEAQPAGHRRRRLAGPVDQLFDRSAALAPAIDLLQRHHIRLIRPDDVRDPAQIGAIVGAGMWTYMMKTHFPFGPSYGWSFLVYEAGAIAGLVGCVLLRKPYG